MNVKLLRKIKELILAEPKRLDMDTYGDRVLPIAGGPKCGTAACICGWAVILKQRIPRKYDAPMPSIGIEDGKVVLEISDSEAARLFFDESWPCQFRDYIADGSAKSAKIAAKRIEHFIKTEGRE